MFDQKRLIEKILYRAQVYLLPCSLLSCARLTIGLDHVSTPRGMVTDNSQLVLRADRMLFSRKVPLVACSLTTANYTPPHGKQAALLIGTKVEPFHPLYLPTKRTQLVERLSRSASLRYPSFKSPVTCLEQRGDRQKPFKKKRYRYRSIVILHPAPTAEMRELPAHSHDRHRTPSR